MPNFAWNWPDLGIKSVDADGTVRYFGLTEADWTLLLGIVGLVLTFQRLRVQAETSGESLFGLGIIH